MKNGEWRMGIENEMGNGDWGISNREKEIENG